MKNITFKYAEKNESLISIKKILIKKKKERKKSKGIIAEPLLNKTLHFQITTYFN